MAFLFARGSASETTRRNQRDEGHHPTTQNIEEVMPAQRHGGEDQQCREDGDRTTQPLETPKAIRGEDSPQGVTGWEADDAARVMQIRPRLAQRQQVSLTLREVRIGREVIAIPRPDGRQQGKQELANLKCDQVGKDELLRRFDATCECR